MALVRSAFTLVLLAALTTAAVAQAPKSAKKSGSDLQPTLEKLEKAGWEAFKNRDQKAFTALCDPEYTAIEADQGPPRDLKAALESMKSFNLNSYSFSDVKATALGSDAGVITYIAHVNLKIDGKPQDIKLGVTSVYVKRGGQWKCLRYHESEIH